MSQTRMTFYVVPHYFDTNRFHGDGEPCLMCGKATGTKKFAHVGGGYAYVMTEDDPNVGDAGDMGFFPIGPDCLRKHPELKPFVFRAKGEPK